MPKRETFADDRSRGERLLASARALTDSDPLREQLVDNLRSGDDLPDHKRDDRPNA